MRQRNVLKKLVAFTLITALAVGATGCGSSKTSNEKVLSVGMECMNAPYNWTQTDDLNGAIKIEGSKDYVNGYDVMIAKKIAEENGYKLKVHKIEWDGLIMAVQSNKINAIIAGMSATEERKTSVDFSEPYYEAEHVLIVKKDSPYAAAKSIEDLSGCRVTSQQGTTMYDQSAPQIPNADIQTALQDIPSLIVAVDSNRCDVAIVEKPMALAAIATNKDLTMVELEEGKGFNVDAGITNIAVAAKKGNKEIIDACNKTIAGMTKEDKDELMKKAISIQPASN